MAYITFNDNRYQLNKKNFDIVKKEEAMYKVMGLVEAYTKQFEYIEACIGEDAVTEIFGTLNIEEVEDFDKVTLLCNEISAEYVKPIVNQGNRIVSRALNGGLERGVKIAKEAKSLRK